MNVPSKKLDRKDVMKVEDRELTQEELDRLAQSLLMPRYQLFEIIVLQKRDCDIWR